MGGGCLHTCSMSRCPLAGPEECKAIEEKALEASGDGRDAPDGAGASAVAAAAAAAVMPGTAGSPVSADEGWQGMVAAAAETADPSPAELAAKSLPLSTSAVTVATATPPPQKPAAKRSKAKQGNCTVLSHWASIDCFGFCLSLVQRFATLSSSFFLCLSFSFFFLSCSSCQHRVGGIIFVLALEFHDGSAGCPDFSA